MIGEYGLAPARFYYTHTMITNEMKKEKGVLCKAFLKKMSQKLDKYTAFAPKGTIYEYKGKDNFSANDISVKDIKNKTYGNAKIINDVTMKEKFNADIKDKTLDDVINSENRGAAALALQTKNIELPATLEWISQDVDKNFKRNKIILASKYSTNFSGKVIQINFMIVMYITKKCKQRRCFLAGYVSNAIEDQVILAS